MKSFEDQNLDDEIISIDVTKLQRMLLLHVSFLVFDVRPKEDFEKGHVKNAFNIPEAEFAQRIVKEIPQKEMPVVIYDQDGSTTRALSLEAAKLGFLNVVILEGGYDAFIVQTVRH